MNNFPSPLVPPTLRDDKPLYPQLVQMLRVTATQVAGPAGFAQAAGSSVLGPTLYVSFTQQMRDDGSLLPRDREPCLANDVNGLGLTPGFYLGRLSGSFNSLPVYEICLKAVSTGGGSDPAPGNNKDVLYNHNGVEAADDSFTYNAGSVVVTSTETTGLGITFTTTINYNFGGTANTYGVYSTNSVGGFGIINVVSNDGISGYYGGFFAGNAGLTPARVGLGSDSYAVDAQTRGINCRSTAGGTYFGDGLPGVSAVGGGNDTFTLGICTKVDGTTTLTGTFP